MLLRVTHVTRFDYDGEIFDTAMELRLRPRDDGRQRLRSHELRVDPPAPVRAYDDAFGNVVQTYNQRAPHRRVVVEASSVVETGLEAPQAPVEPTRGERFQMTRFVCRPIRSSNTNRSSQNRTMLGTHRPTGRSK